MSPRPFTDAERENVQRALLAAARRQFERSGYRKTTIEAVAREAGVAKGTVYLFVDSKAELFLQVVLEVEDAMHARTLRAAARPAVTPRERLRSFLRQQMRTLAEHPLLAVMLDPMEAAALLRDITPDRLRDLRRRDEDFYALVVARWREADALEREHGRSRSAHVEVEPRLLAALPRALMAMTLHRELIGTRAVFDEVLDVVIDGILDRLCGRDARLRTGGDGRVGGELG